MTKSRLIRSQVNAIGSLVICQVVPRIRSV